jgi:transglutaminase-like putative cysteine protease
MKAYLEPSRYINWQHPDILAKAEMLSRNLERKEDIAKTCFIFVRNEIRHSLDYKLNPVTCSASEVLHHGTGYCFAKSHLLAALLRANAIPAGLCYQRLTSRRDTPEFCLHGLNAIHLEEHGWYRVDARGNKPGVQAEFDPPTEQLAFPIVTTGEADLPEIWAEPLDIIINVLKNGKDYQHVLENLPDIPLIHDPKIVVRK